MVSIYNLELTDQAGAAFDQLLPFVSDERQKKILSYRFRIDQLLSLYGALMTRMALGQLCGIPAGALSFAAGENGKPYLLDDPTCYFNLSHTRSYLLVGVSRQTALGADVESGTTTPPYEIMNNCFHAEEIAYVDAADRGRSERFYEIWTKKEAYVKRSGLGLTSELTTINTLALSDYFYCYQQSNYICSICSEKNTSFRSIMLTEADISEFYLPS